MVSLTAIMMPAHKIPFLQVPTCFLQTRRLTNLFTAPSCVTAYWGLQSAPLGARRFALAACTFHRLPRSRLVDPWQVEHLNPIRERRRRRGILSHEVLFQPSTSTGAQAGLLINEMRFARIGHHEIEDLFTGASTRPVKAIIAALIGQENDVQKPKLEFNIHRP